MANNGSRYAVLIRDSNRRMTSLFLSPSYREIFSLPRLYKLPPSFLEMKSIYASHDETSISVICAVMAVAMAMCLSPCELFISLSHIHITFHTSLDVTALLTLYPSQLNLVSSHLPSNTHTLANPDLNGKNSPMR